MWDDKRWWFVRSTESALDALKTALLCEEQDGGLYAARFIG